MVRVLVADDHPIVRRGLRQILDEEADLQLVGEAHNSQKILELVRQRDCDLLIMGMAMPGRGGLEVLRQIKQEYPGIRVLILSMHPEDHYGVRAMKAGASGYVTKESTPDKLLQALRKIVNGGKYISPALAEKLAFRADGGPQGSFHDLLSDREFQVLCMIASGKTISEIALDLSLSAKTISTYRTRILEKMGMKSSAEITHYAIKNQLV